MSTRPESASARPIDDHTATVATRTSWQARALRVLKDDVWAKGVSGTLQTALRMVRLVARWPSHRAWLRVIGGPTTRSVLAVYPRIVYLHSFTYLFAGTTWPQRLSMVNAHYAFLNRHHDAAFFDAALAPGGLVLWRETRDGHDMSIALLGPCLTSRHHEGDLTLAFAMDGTTLCRIAFSIIGTGALIATGAKTSHLIYVGQVQGTAGVQQSIRVAIQCMNAVAPRDLLISALAGAATAWGIDTIVGVSGARLLSNEAWRNSSSRFDYERFWLEHGAIVDDEGHHVMRLPFAVKPLSAIATRHRGRTLLKRQLKSALSAEMARAVGERLTTR